MNYIEEICQSLITNNKINQWAVKRLSTDKIQLLNNYYKDSDSLNETIYRVLNNLNVRPICITCGCKVKFINFVKGFSTHCCVKCAKNDPQTQQKMIQTCLKRYGVINGGASKQAQEKIRKTMYEHYGVEYAFKTKEVKDKIIETHRKTLGVDWPMQSKQVQEKSKQTCLQKYGCEYTGQTEIKKQKSKETFLKHYGVDHNWKNKECFQKCIDNRFKNKIEVNNITSSKPEQICFNLLKTKFNKIIRQKRDKNKYPFYCDFYIKDIDTWIEYNGFMTHGGHPFNSENNEDQQILEDLKIKNQNHIKPNNNLYYSTIYTWTIQDPLKRKTAKDNNLNYLEFFNLNDFEMWLRNYD